jgi:hypothetical protein
MGIKGARQRKHGGDRAIAPEAAPEVVAPRRLSELEELERRELEARSVSAPDRPGEERWQPIVVDRAGYEFEPKPPTSGHLYFPDTVFDGWTSAAFTIRLASVRGYSHRFRAQPRQDHAEVELCEVDGREAVIFAVADGVSNSDHGELGALFAVQAAMPMLRRQAARGGPLDWRSVLVNAVGYMSNGAGLMLGALNTATDELAKLMSTTIVLGVVEEAPDGVTVSMARVGDSGAWVLNSRNFQPVFAPKRGADPGLVSSAVTALPLIPERIPSASFGMSPDDVLLIGTDGFGDPLGDGTGEIGKLFAHWLDRVPPARGFAHLLDFSRDTFDDDRTLLAIWPYRRPIGAAS